jgi:hypothetical protein
MLADESMSGWCLRTTKLGGLSIYTFEPQKPVPFGTMLCNGVECISGIFMVQDVVRNSEQQSLKANHATKSSLPDGSDVAAHIAEVLRMQKSPKEDG